MMRTSVTLDADVWVMVERAMDDRSLSFDEVVNEAVRTGLTPDGVDQQYTESRSMGPADVDLDRALTIVGIAEDAAAVQRLVSDR